MNGSDRIIIQKKAEKLLDDLRKIKHKKIQIKIKGFEFDQKSKLEEDHDKKEAKTDCLDPRY